MSKTGKSIVSRLHFAKTMLFATWLGCLLSLNQVLAQNFIAQVSANKVAKGQPFMVQFTLENAQGEFKPPKFDGFQVVGGPNQSTQMSFVNGDFSRQVSISYYIVATRTGKLTIDEAFITLKNGNAISTRPITIEVVEGSGNVANSNPNSNQRSAYPAGSQQADGTDKNIEQQVRENVFMKAIVNKANVKKGEQISVTYKLYTAVNLAQYAIKEMPQLNGFWSKDIITPDKTQITEEVLNGKRYKVGIFKKTVLFPQKTGTLKIDPLKVDVIAQVPVRQKRRNIFADIFGDDPFFNDDFFSDFGVDYQNIPLNLASQAVTIQVGELPNPQPESFTGAVGKFNIHSSLSSNQTKTDEPITLKLTVTGSGNLSMVTPPTLNVGNEFETYEPKIKENINVGETVNGSKTIEYIIIPRNPGKFTIPSIPFSYYDIEKRQYVELSTQSAELIVARNENSNTAISNVAPSQSAIPNNFTKDIRYINTENNLIDETPTFFNSIGFWSAVTLPFFSALAFILYRRKKGTISSETIRMNKAKKVALSRLTQAQSFMAKGDAKAFHNEVIRSIWGYLSDKFGLNNTDLDRHTIAEKLRQQNQTEQVTSKLFDVLDTCEMSLFGGIQNNEALQKTYNDSIDLLTQMEENKLT